MKAFLEVVAGSESGRVFTFDGYGTFIVGRVGQADLTLRDETRTLSRRHFLIEINPPLARVQDLRSRNGTFVNGDRVAGADLKPGDVIGVGRTRIRYAVERSNERVSVRCLRCNEEGMEAYRDCLREDAAFVCEECREEIARNPQPLPGHEVLKELGRGAMGVVYLAQNIETRKAVAFKILLPKLVSRRKLLEHFKREIVMLQELQGHPNIVEILDYGELTNQGLPYLLTEYVDGMDAQRIVQESTLSESDVLSVGCQCLDGIAYAHKKQVIHRDLKPANLVLQGRPGSFHATLLDFGLAKNYCQDTGSLTITGDSKGTIPFMSPEQIEDVKRVGPCTDIYSMGAVLYYLVSGCFIYAHWDPDCTDLRPILEEPVVPLSERGVAVSPIVENVIMRALEKEPARRFRSAREMRRALCAARREK